jgi:glucan phosphoethanolaminetransferase (alkaline phosphatase superfamily)
MLSYRNLVHARSRWSAWSRRVSWGVFALMVMEAILTCYFILLAKVFAHSVTLPQLGVTFGASALLFIFCVFSLGAMLYHHDQISKYREKVL